MGNWYNFLVKIKPDGKAFRSIFYSKILYEVIANGIDIVKNYAVFIINDQVWYVNDNFNPEPWESRYAIDVPEFSTLEQRRQVVKSYMLFPQYQNRLSLDYFQLSLNNAGYSGITVAYNTSFVSDSSIRITTEILNAGIQEIEIPNGGYIDDNYDFTFQAYDLNGYKTFPVFVSKSPTSITFNLDQQSIVTITTLKPTALDSLRTTTELVLEGVDQSITIPFGGYLDTDYEIMFQAYDSSGFETPIIFKSKTNTEVLFDIPQDVTVTLSTFKPIVDDLLRITSDIVDSGIQEIEIPYGGYLDTNYDFSFQAYDSSGHEVYPIYISKTQSKITLNIPQQSTVTLKTFGIINNGDESSFMHANDFADEKAEFDIGLLTYNFFVVQGEISANLYKNVVSLLMSLKPPQVVMYDKLEVLQAIALDDNLAIALDDNLTIALTVL